ncbi:putative PKS/NRPS-like protein biosynthetic cluster [Aspergillus brasiliensis]|uniref:PKS/NRPS-like protein biosynthetic cluster n=1 Tax=Aspergillus brasiliensis TaxID=319629 RepID=A0A9W5YEU0_9EURO|nr:putative PKS/NRPS-like protein biosynthetic cluster [Aspergillus brasiliensis]GKZ40787.1 putative PKS/NRPS-like protein biosynthetic cluster [Aspergillus brasiliensis]
MKLDADFHESRATEIEQTFRRYTVDLPVPTQQEKPPVDGHTVLLTGTTGSLGSYILYSLLDRQDVARIYCLNRAEDAQSRQIESFQSRGLGGNLADNPKVNYLTVDFSKDRLGLCLDAWTQLQTEATVIIHNAWTVNFVVPLQAFEKVHVKGTRTLIDLSLTATHRVHLCLISSTSTVYFWPKRYEGGVPERFVRDAELPMHIGYSESKYVAELMLDEAARVAGLNTSIVRLGQVGGPTTSTGVWNTSDVFPIVLATSIKLGMVPIITGFGGAVDWIPLESAGDVIWEIVSSAATAADQPGPRVFNLVNPNSLAWKEIATALQEMYPVQIVSIPVWLENLEQAVATSSDPMKDYPATRISSLIDRWFKVDKIPDFEFIMEATQAVSPTLQKLEPIQRDWFLGWLRQWNFSPELMLYD